ncbi:MAG: hypothetical protein LBD46_04830 [Endomicrobium sp.]|jgi:hypothetical protein|nr:hypothetical protein [Endomicrobium sp.]
MDFLKAKLGEELFNQVKSKLEGTGIKLVDLSTGEYVSKDKHTRIIAEHDEAIKKKDGEIANLQSSVAGDEKLKKRINDLEGDVASYQSKITRFEHEKTVSGKGIQSKYMDAAISQAEKLVSKDTPFDKAVDSVLETYPEWKTETKVTPEKKSTFPLNNNNASTAESEVAEARAKANDVFRKAGK